MTGYRPSTLVLEDLHCPAAIRYHEEQTPWAHELTHTGTAAHAFLEALGRHVAKNKRRTVPRNEIEVVADIYHTKLIAEGRSFDGHPRPPLPARAVEEGKHLALNWVSYYPLDPEALYEVGLGWRGTPGEGDWTTDRYSPNSNRLRCILDVLQFESDEGEDDVFDWLVVRDYKTAWRADKSYLDHTQQRVQALAAIDYATATGRKWDGVRIEIANLRTRQLHRREILRGDDDELIAGWRKSICLQLEGLDRSRFEHRPGMGCVDCPYWGSCGPGRDYTLALSGGLPPEKVGEWLALHESTIARVEVLARKYLEHRDPELHGAYRVGYLPRPRRRLTSDAVDAIVEAWLGPAHPAHDAVVGLLTVHGVSVTGVQKVAQHLYGRADGRVFADAHCEVEQVAEFRVEKAS